MKVEGFEKFRKSDMLALLAKVSPASNRSSKMGRESVILALVSLGVSPDDVKQFVLSRGGRMKGRLA